MSKGLRWLVGGLVAGVLVVTALFVGFFGGVWALVGTSEAVTEDKTVAGEVVSVDPVADEVTVAFDPPAPGADDQTVALPWRDIDPLPEVGRRVGVRLDDAGEPESAGSFDEVDDVADARVIGRVGVVLLWGALGIIVAAAIVIAITAAWAARAPARTPPAGVLPGSARDAS